jgi:Holliday junction resolvasome RuvABC endonuclease subunit
MSQRILALDCATHLGYAHNAGPHGALVAGVVDFSPPTRKAERAVWTPGHRWREVRTWLQEIAARVRPELLVFERAIPQRAGMSATEIAYGMTTRVEELAAELQIPARLKLWATGDGRADKQAMMRAAQQRYGLAFPDDNAADAALILGYALAGFPEPERQKRKAAARRRPQPSLSV